jgi:aminoglycoside phosphotransferase
VRELASGWWTPRVRHTHAAGSGRAERPVWVNVQGGITFAIGTGSQRRFVKWAPAGSGIDLGAEAARLRWARFAVVPRLLGDGADTTGSWIITNALAGRHSPGR